MIYLFIRHTIGDYQQWKESFDIHLAARQAGGATGEVYLLHSVDLPNDVAVILGWHTLHQAISYSMSVSWQMAFRQMGLVGVPEVRFLERVN